MSETFYIMDDVTAANLAEEIIIAAKRLRENGGKYVNPPFVYGIAETPGLACKIVGELVGTPVRLKDDTQLLQPLTAPESLPEDVKKILDT